MKRFVASLALTLFAALSQAQTQPGLVTYSTVWNNLNRSYAVYTPPKGLPANPMIVMFLNGTWPNCTTVPWQATPQWEAEARTGQFLLVLPFSTCVPHVNQSYWASSDVSFAFPTPPDDAGFLCNLALQFNTAYPTNSGIYLTGMSSGGLMTQTVAQTCPQNFQAFAPVSAQIYIKQIADPWEPPATLPVPVSILEIHGDADTDLQYCGQTPHQQWTISYMTLPSVDQDMAYWTSVNGLPAPTQFLCTNGLPTPGVQSFDEVGANNVEVKFLDNPGGIHIWPTWAYATVYEFFAAHPKL